MVHDGSFLVFERTKTRRGAGKRGLLRRRVVAFVGGVGGSVSHF